MAECRHRMPIEVLGIKESDSALPLRLFGHGLDTKYNPAGSLSANPTGGK